MPAADVGGLSGHSVRGAAEASLPAVRTAGEAAGVPSPGAESAPSMLTDLADTVRDAAGQVLHGLDVAGRTLGQGVDYASSQAFERAAEVTPASASALGQPAFSWSGYVQAIGILCLLLALLWFVLWLVRRYGRFSFLPRPGALPRGALVMEAQMPLGPRKGLMVVRFLNKRLLLGVTEQQITLLGEDDAHLESQDKDFEGVMDDCRRRMAGGDVSDRPSA